MELYIETLTGTAFELRVSPFETILSVKAKIQRLEGIPISQQHLIWQSVELEDDYCLHDYSITDGATLRLVLAMRGGPINTRRIPREMEEYMDANRDDWERVSGRQVTLVVYRDGDQLNFFRLVPGDGTLSPLSESALSGASMYNLYDEDEDEDIAPKEKVEENEKTKEKMTLLRTKMESLTLNKKPKKKPHLPTSGRPGSKSKLRRIHASAKPIPVSTLTQYNKFNKNACLPPVGQSSTSADNSAAGLSDLLISDPATAYSSPTKNYLDSVESISSSKLKRSLSCVKEDLTCASRPSSGQQETNNRLLKRGVSKERSSAKQGQEKEMDPLAKVLTSASSSRPADGHQHEQASAAHSSASNASKKELTLEALKETLKLPLSSSSTSSKSNERLSRDVSVDHLSIPSTSARKDLTFESLKETLGKPLSSSKFGSLDRKRGEITLESLSQAESRVMSGLLRQASIERLGSSKISTFVHSASKSRGGFTLGSAGLKDGRIPTPEGRLVSARLSRLSSSRDGRMMSPTHLLPPVKKKKASKRCFVCGKKTGLATSYLCRCGKNFCLNHRYAESHECTFDYKTEGRKLLEQSNPVVSAPKLPKI